jgi:hypothetical protein
MLYEWRSIFYLRYAVSVEYWMSASEFSGCIHPLIIYIILTTCSFPDLLYRINKINTSTSTSRRNAVVRIICCSYLVISRELLSYKASINIVVRLQGGDRS